MKLKKILFFSAVTLILLSGITTAQAHSEFEEEFNSGESVRDSMPIMLVDGHSENSTSLLVSMIAGGSIVATLLAFRFMKKK